jgi:hypothetical protein
MMNNNTAVAEKLKKLLIESSPLIEEYTAAVCPACTDVCCRQKHGLYREVDSAYLKSLGITAPRRDGSRQLEGPCESMGPKGCIQPRWMRPIKCTWYFCEPLLNALDEGSPRKARRLYALLGEMTELFGELAGNHDSMPTRSAS